MGQTFWSTEPGSEDFDKMLTCRKARFLNGKTSTKLFALFSFWVDVFILYIFHILYIPLLIPQKDSQLLTKKEPITDWMITVSHKPENIMWVNRFCCVLPRQAWKHWSLKTDLTLFYSTSFYLRLTMPKKLQKGLIWSILVALIYLWSVYMRLHNKKERQ